ncbi:ABC transporter ATP-binding protein [Acidisphaera sp. L21]|uniref:ABC transporter ATP-binding protein n=1 Tax=Acidisphaera sp. L21 TaxID=1641851 RepID=UPI00131B0870|nr:ABC transporter ATP-binding protein [Acidisphaera sp. L21]
MSHVDVAGLTVRYGGWTALEGLDLGIGRGELFVLLGGSGSGKTTLLRTLAGFIAPAAGRIMLGGRDITTLPPHKRPVNTMFQSYALFPHMSVAANVGFGLRRQGMNRADTDRRVAELLALVRMEAFADRRPDALSGGQRQRVALARSLAPRPELLLLDEPLSALDRGLREATRAELVRVQRQLGTTFVLVTHDQEEALSMATRIGLLEQGRLAQVGTPTEIYERPVSRSVAAFMGAANILPATVREPGMLDLPSLGVVAQADTRGMTGDIHLALRPERLRVSRASAGGPNSVAGVVAESAYRGIVVDHRVRVGEAALLVSQPLGDGAGVAALPPGEAVCVSWTPDACILLAE